MPNKKLEDLAEITALSGTDQLMVDGNKRITVTKFSEALAGSAITCGVTGGPTIDHGYPVVTGNLRLKNGSSNVGQTVEIYFGSSSGDSWVRDGSTVTDSSGNYSYAARPKGDGPRTVMARVEHIWSAPYAFTTDQIDAAATGINALLDYVIEGLPAGTKLTRLDAIGGIVDDSFTFTMLDTQGSRFAISGKYLVQGATSTTAAGGTRHPQVRATSIYTGLHVDATLDMRVFAEPDWVTEPTAADPYDLGLDVVFDMNPQSTMFNGGSITNNTNIDTAAFATLNAAKSATIRTDAFASLSTSAYKPKWIADGGFGKPCIRTSSANQGLKSTDTALCALFDGDHPVLTIITIYKQATVPAGAAFVFSARQASTGNSTTPNASGQRMLVRADYGHVSLNIGDNQGAISGNTGSSWAASSGISANDTTCAFAMNGSKTGFGVERDFDWTTRFGVRDKNYHPFSADTATTDVTIGDKGGQLAGMIGDFYRMFVIRGVPTLRQRYAIVKWAHAQYGLSHPATWAPLDLDTKVTTYNMDDHISTSIYDIVTHGATPGDQTPANLGWQSMPAGSSSTAYAGYIHTLSEDTGFPNILNPVWRDRMADEPDDSEVWHYWQNMIVGETKLTPLGYEPYLYLADVQKNYIGPTIVNRYGGTKYLHGQFSGEYIIPSIAKGGRGMWGGFWSLGDASTSSTTYNEQDLQEHDGADLYGLYQTTHDATLSGGALGYYFIGDDQSAAINQVVCDVQPDYLTYYYNGLPMWRQPTPTRNQGSKYGLIDLTTGKTANAFHGAIDNTTVMPNSMSFRKMKFTRNPIAAPTGMSSTPSEVTALLATMTSPTTDEQAMVLDVIRKLKGHIALYPDGSSYSLYDKLNYLYFFAMTSSANTLRDWKNPARAAATIVGSPTFTAGQGFKSNTNGDYIDTGIIMSAAGFANNAADQCMGVWNLTQPTDYTKRFAHGDDRYQVNPAPSTTGVGKTNTTYVVYGSSAVEVLYNDVGPGLHSYSRGFGQVTPWFNGEINGIMANQSTTSIDTSPAFSAVGSRRILSATGGTTSASMFDGKVSLAYASAWLVEDHQVKLYEILRDALISTGAIT